MMRNREATMSRRLPHTIRLAILLAITPFLWVPGNAAFPGAGREFARCTHACNDVRPECHDRCLGYCSALGGTEDEQDACLLACDAVCVAQTQDCKFICNYYVLKHNEPPYEP
jgi:hypothetical protein